MARIPSVASLNRRLVQAKAREAALKTRQTTAVPDVGGGQANPTDNYKYKSVFTNGDVLVRASRPSVVFFGGIVKLGLVAPDDSPGLPRGFKPSKIRATRGKATPTPETAALSGRRYLKYSVDAGTDTRATYTAPISAATVAALQTLYRAIVTDKATEIGEYGRIAFIPEQPLFSSTGTAAP